MNWRPWTWRRPWLVVERDRNTNVIYVHGRYWTTAGAARRRRSVQAGRGWDRRYVIYTTHRERIGNGRGGQ